MKVEMRTGLVVGRIIVLIGIIFFGWYFYDKYQDKRRENDFNVNRVKTLESSLASLTDTVRTIKNKKGEWESSISTLRFQNTDQLLKLGTTGLELTRLKKEIEKYKKELKEDGSSLTIFNSKTQLLISKGIQDSLKGKLVLGRDLIQDSVKNEWVDASFGFTKDSSFLKLELENEYTVLTTINESGEGYSVVTNHNPYSKTGSLRAYQTKVIMDKPKEKKFSVFLGTGYGVGFIPVDSKIEMKTTPFIGLGVGIKVFSF